MSSILRKAMWPAALIIGMFVLIGAIGTATAPTASAATDEICKIVGPFPDFSGLGTDNDNELLIEGNEYLFVVVLDDPTGAVTTYDFNVDDETGRAGITAFAITPATPAWDTEPSVDNIVGAELATLDIWDNDADFIPDIEANFFVDIQTDVLDPLTGNGTADECTGAAAVPEDVTLGFVTVECTRNGTFELTAIEGAAAVIIAPWTEQFECVNPPSSLELTALPIIVESYPALGNISHSLLIAQLTDGDGHYVSEGYEVDFDATDCSIQALDLGGFQAAEDDFNAWAASMTPQNAAEIELSGSSHSGFSSTAISFNYNPDGSALAFGSYAAAVLHCEGADPGTVTVTAEVEDDQVTEDIEMGPSSDLDDSVDITVIGPPAFIEMVAEPTELVCGEKAQILITVSDILNQPVSDHTRVELITNYGGVIGGTGSSLGFPGVNPVNPLSSSAAETFGGVATAYLLTSTNHIGPYEVVAAAGGSNLGGYSVSFGGDAEETFFFSGAQFSTPVVTDQVTVTCTEGEEPDVTAPDTGTGTISPPNTGDAGLASGSTSATLFVIAGAVAFVLAGFAKLGFARRS